MTTTANRSRSVVSRRQIVEDLRRLGIEDGDNVLIRADLGQVGLVEGRAAGFLDALLESVGPNGTVVSLAFTRGTYPWKLRREEAFTAATPSYAGALSNAMLRDRRHQRSRHPMCSFVAIGPRSESLLNEHDETSPAYEPVAKLIKLHAKCVVIGCVDSSPGFTTAHVAEYDLGLHRRILFPGLTRAYFLQKDGSIAQYRRTDPGLCSQSYLKFYAHYVAAGILRTGIVGQTHAILALANQTYTIERTILEADPRFNVCDDPDCLTCNVRRWDRLHCLPRFLLRRAWRKILRR